MNKLTEFLIDIQKIFKGDVKLNNVLIKTKEYEFFVRATEKLKFFEYKNNTKIEKDLFKRYFKN